MQTHTHCYVKLFFYSRHSQHTNNLFALHALVLWILIFNCTHFYSLPFFISLFKVPVLKPTDLMVEVRPRRVFANGHTYHINSISVNSDGETYLSADDLRINMWHLDITDRSFSILCGYDLFHSIYQN